MGKLIEKYEKFLELWQIKSISTVSKLHIRKKHLNCIKVFEFVKNQTTTKLKLKCLKAFMVHILLHHYLLI